MRRKKKNILKKLTRLNLALSAQIEESGHDYGAKMILLADTLTEKSLFALFAAEEAIHLKEFENFIKFQIDRKIHWHPMLDPLNEAIKEGTWNTSLFIIQVLLEGFGIAHYNGLKNDCLHNPLVSVYERILKDEARHHGAGVILVNEKNFSREDQEQVFEFTRSFIGLLPTANWVQTALEEQRGGLSLSETNAFYEDIGHHETVNIREKKLKEMIEKVNCPNLIKQLEADKVF